MNNTYYDTFDDISDRHTYSWIKFLFTLSFCLDVGCDELSDEINKVDDLFTRVKLTKDCINKDDGDEINEGNEAVKECKNQSNTVIYNKSGAKVLIKDDHSTLQPLMQPSLISVDNDNLENRRTNNRVDISLPIDENISIDNERLVTAIGTIFPINEMEVDRSHDTNNMNHNITDELMSNTAEVINSGYLLPSTLDETIISQSNGVKHEKKELNIEQNSNVVAVQRSKHLVINKSKVKNNAINNPGILNTYSPSVTIPETIIQPPLTPPKPLTQPPPSDSYSIMSSNVDENVRNDVTTNAIKMIQSSNIVEDVDSVYKRLIDVYLRNNDIPEGLRHLFEKHLYQEPKGWSYSVPKDINKKEIEERLTYNCMPPQPEYFDPNNKELGYKCWYDIENPHPYKNPFEMFSYKDGNCRRKLRSTNKYYYESLSNGRIICLLCAVLHNRKIVNIKKQIHDWDVIDTDGNGITECTSCHKKKQQTHFNQDHAQCTYCASLRTYRRYIIIR